MEQYFEKSRFIAVAGSKPEKHQEFAGGNWKGAFFEDIEKVTLYCDY